MTRVQVDVLGPLRVWVDDHEVDLGGARSRALVARLALAGNRPVSAAALVADLWGDDLPAGATNALQSVVSRTRRRLPEGSLELTPAGYVLRCDRVDAAEFERLVGDGRADAGLALWRGEALADVSDAPFAAADARRLAELRLTAVEASLSPRVHGDPTVVADLDELTAAHPYRDGLWRLLLTALASHGRANEALARYEQLRAMLADELGTSPSPELQQLHVSILRGDHEPVRRVHRSLPAGLTSFVGREGAIADLAAALVDHRLVTILGPGGAGKTRLSIETARSTSDRFEHVWLAELAAVTGDDGIVPAVVAAMGLREVVVLERPSAAPRPDERTRLVEAVRDVEGLLVLDNCEHLVDGVARLVADLLAHAPSMRVLATSREPLRIIGEFSYQVSPLTMPAADDAVEDALAHSAVQLFVQRAQAVDRAFALTPETLPAVREICVRLDGQPLAIELAAARLRTLTASQVAARLSDRFQLLTGGSRTALPRHRTLRAVVEWSWDLLDDDERGLAESLAVFPGGVTLESAAAVHGGAERTEELVESLTDKSLLVAVRGGTPRFRMLETLREYGLERLVERGVVGEVRQAHLEHFLSVAEAGAVGLRGSGQLEALARLDADLGNIMAALRFAIDGGDRARAARFVTALGWFWSIRSQHQESFDWATTVLGLPGTADAASEICTEALGIAGILAASQFDTGPDAAWREPVGRVLALWDEHEPDHPVVHVVMAAIDFFGVAGGRTLDRRDDPWTRAMIDLLRIVMLDNSGRLSESVELIDPVIEAFREIGERWGLAMGLTQRATIQSIDGDVEAALASWQEALPLLAELGAAEDVDFSSMRVTALRVARATEAELHDLRRELEAVHERAVATGNRRHEAVTRMNMAVLEHVMGHDAEAVVHLEHVLAHRDPTSEFGSGQMESLVRSQLAVARLGVGDAAGAARELAAAARVGLQTKDMPVLAEVAGAAAFLAHGRGHDEDAARLLGAAVAIRGRADRSNRDAAELAEALRRSLGPSAFERLRAEGAALDQQAAATLALADTGLTT
ncbi:BTAD domain-containing putative transcriptional regulator [Aeromicrobium endophyticum]|uniref:AfsR/SARP family transcriptional regulator n=1 Tax=Aeromicrobium endophyticum TaxID=2292704 RepID=A0A371P8S8_9ACTN|nr:BTAD domain-containing putative transcriptional regulator [Aeromicrobium endophyticum]REK72305.1 AfsR/SARP family transcriptional regulator [Aeromicrobium endophyticum]